MITKLIIRNFKKFDEAIIDLGSRVVFVGPNNSGKTTALQALTLWEIAVRRWFERRIIKRSKASERTGVSINRKDILCSPVPNAKYLWNSLHVRRGTTKGDGTKGTQNIRIDIEAEGVIQGKPWACGFEYDFQGEESLLCRPLRLKGFEELSVKDARYSEIPDMVSTVHIAYLPPMSGLSSREDRLDLGAVRRRIGEGLTAEVLRNLCYMILNPPNGEITPEVSRKRWEKLVETMRSLFGITLLEPEYYSETGEITLSYREVNDLELDISLAGRGMQQCLLLFAYLYSNPNSILLLDEPDAHLEFIRQQQIYNRLCEAASEQNSQIIAASHSEIVLDEAAEKDQVVFFTPSGHPKTIGFRDKSQVRKALVSIGFENYLQAEQKGWVLYLEGSSDRAILKTFARKLGLDEIARIIDEAFVHYISTNLPEKAREHFYGLRQAVPSLKGLAIFDRLDKELQEDAPLKEVMWKKREIENYFCLKDVLLRFARGKDVPYDLIDWIDQAEERKREEVMKESVEELEKAAEVRREPSPWTDDCKVSDDFLAPLIKNYSRKLRLPDILGKSDFYTIAEFIEKKEIPDEVREKLNMISEFAD